MRLIGSFQTITIQGRSRSSSSPSVGCSCSTSAGASVAMRVFSLSPPLLPSPARSRCLNARTRTADTGAVASESAAEQFRTLVANIPGAVYRCRLDDDYTMVFLSEAIEEITGYPATDFIENAVRSYASIIHPDDADIDQSWENEIRERRSFDTEY